ncbi:unnamed protein product [Prunus armeniaca]|uniref:Uncharacterized protein n=1 Tax=Prunus armeniaca TaxID=36596 RepID=A0A6J5VBF8_PRUAR|nr:unnamed protein product [Prunus armeniaca]
MDGKRFTWKGIFVEIFSKLFLTLSSPKGHLQTSFYRRRATSILNEKVREGVGGGDRNKEKVDQLFVLSTHNMASQIVALFTKENCPIKIDNSLW